MPPRDVTNHDKHTGDFNDAFAYKLNTNTGLLPIYCESLRDGVWNAGSMLMELC